MIANKSSSDSKRDSQSNTPGKPRSTGSRQQTHPNQNSRSGSEEFDKASTSAGGEPAEGAKPSSAK
jgi:hypothetical protein